MKKRKAQVSLIVWILLVLIAIIAIAIVWNFVIPFIREKAGEVETSPLTINLNVEEVILVETGPIKVRVKREIGKGELTGLKFVFYDGEGKTKIETIEDNLLNELESKIYYFSAMPEIGQITRVSVVPVIGNSLGAEFQSEVNKIIEIPSGLVSWWEFNGNAGDLMQINNGVFNSFIEDGDIMAASFSGANDIDVGNDSSLDINNHMAVSFWIKTSDADASIIKKGNNYEISLVGSRIKFAYGVDERVDDGSANIVNGEWHHIVAGSMGIYIDGEYKATSISSPTTNNDSVIIGENFEGLIDEIMFFNKPLDPDSISYLYENQRPNFLIR